jgi:hypothetical protein
VQSSTYWPYRTTLSHSIGLTCRGGLAGRSDTSSVVRIPATLKISVRSVLVGVESNWL